MEVFIILNPLIILIYYYIYNKVLKEDDLRRLDDVTKEFSSLTLRNLAIAMKEISASDIENFNKLFSSYW